MENKVTWLEVTIGSGIFKVADFGAKGDGKSDDTKHIQAAFDAAAKAGGGTVLFSPACASFDQYPNFRARALAFQAVAQRASGVHDS